MLGLALAVVPALYLLNRPGRQDLDEVNDRVSQQSVNRSAAKIPPLDEGIRAFRAAWDGSDLDALGSLYPLRHQARAGRLDERVAARGWSNALPRLGPTVLDSNESDSIRRSAWFDIAGGEVRTTWMLENGQWRMHELVLPEVSKERLAAAVEATQTGRTIELPPVEDEAVKPVLRVRIASAEDLLAVPGVEFLPLAVRDVGASATAVWEPLTALWKTIAWPVELRITMFPDREIGFALDTSNPEPFVEDWWHQSIRELVGDKASEREPPEWSKLDVRGNEYRYFSLGPWGAFFEGRADRHQVVFLQGAARRQDRDRLRRLTASIPEPRASAAELWERTDGAEIRVFVNFDAVLNLAPPADRSKFRETMQLLGGDVSALAARCDRDGERFSIDTFVDLRAGEGLLGVLLTPPPELELPVGWIPEEAHEFYCGRFDSGGLRRLVDAILTFLPMQTSAWGDVFADFEAANLLSLVDQLDGRVLALGQRSTPAEVMDPDAEVPLVLLLGTEDPAALREDIERWFEGVARSEPAPELGPTAHAVVTEDSMTLAYVIELPGMLALSPASPRDFALLRAVIATNGQGQTTADFRSRIPHVPADACSLFVGSKLSDAAARQAMRPEQVDRESAKIQRTILDALSAAGGGVNAGWTAMRADGFHVRIVY